MLAVDCIAQQVLINATGRRSAKPTVLVRSSILLPNKTTFSLAGAAGLARGSGDLETEPTSFTSRCRTRKGVESATASNACANEREISSC
jgi:hypothetical protein